MTTADRLRWWLGIFETTRDEELDCDALFDALDTVAEAAAMGEDVGELFPAIALHLHTARTAATSTTPSSTWPPAPPKPMLRHGGFTCALV